MRTFKNSLSTNTKFWLKPFAQDNEGNIAIIFGLTVIPVMLAAGLGVDYTQASDAKAFMQASADSAIISAILDTTTSTCASKQTNATKIVTPLMSEKSWVHYNNDLVLSDDLDGGCKVTFSAKVDTAIVKVIGINTMNVSVTASAVGGIGKKLEIALALDNTASMKDQGMIDLRFVANTFVDTLSAKVPATQLKIGLVPFVAMVNPGKDFINNSSMSDYKGEADYHGYYFSGRVIDGAMDCGGSGGFSTSGGTAFPKETMLLPKENLTAYKSKFAYIMHELLGTKAAYAAELGGGNTTPTDLTTIMNTWVLHSFTIPNTATTGYVAIPPTSTPFDFTFGTPYYNAVSGKATCEFYNPLRVNHFDLFTRTGPAGVPWKGCVMARKAPYDIDDSAPISGDANTKFVPFFWPSEPAVDINMAYNGIYSNPTNPVYNNAYLAPPFWPAPAALNTYLKIGLLGGDPVFSHADILKYNNTNNSMTSMPIIENAVDTLGPNKGCPNAVTPLTSNLSDIKTQINNLTRWNGGGTVTSEGLMWAWRVLSPNLPYAMGAPYSDTSVKKYIVLMTDGVNYINNTGPNVPFPDESPITAEQTAYGSIWGSGQAKTFAPQVVGAVTGSWADGIYDKAAADALLNDRFTKACDNAKASGIKVFAIYFSHGDPVNATAVDYLKNCAGAGNYYTAVDSTALQVAFNNIAKSIVAGGVRLTK